MEPPDYPPHIRLASEKDLPRILKIEKQSFTHQWDYYFFKEALKEDLFVFEEGKILGYLASCCCSLSKRGVILKVAVDPEYRGRGVATQLISAALNRFKELKLDSAELDVDIMKTSAIRLYEKLGFKAIRIVVPDPEIDENEEEFLMMHMKLTGA
ncbi:MAG: GNAT family N-acetyltransferase [Deltaproteobacteria bacterium]|nr:GNAT family N-acetyltransferase [Deltaproteobacteria bacterium]